MSAADERNPTDSSPLAGELPTAEVDVNGAAAHGEKPGHSTRRNRWLPTRLQAVAAFGVAAALLLAVDRFAFESVVVPSASMEPTVLRNERVFLNRLPGQSIRRFDVVVVDSRALGRRIAKRVVGLPGERVRLEASWKVFVDGESLAYSEASAGHTRTEAGDHEIRLVAGPTPPAATRFGREDLLLGPGEYFVLGDNRLASTDSRVIGPVKREEIQGKLGLVWYSFDLEQHRIRAGRLGAKVR